MCFVVTCWERADLLALVCGVFCEFVTFPLVSWVRCGTWLYRFLIFAPLLTFDKNTYDSTCPRYNLCSKYCFNNAGNSDSWFSLYYSMMYTYIKRHHFLQISLFNNITVCHEYNVAIILSQTCVCVLWFFLKVQTQYEYGDTKQKISNSLFVYLEQTVSTTLEGRN